MSSSYIVEPQEGGSKKDDTLILMVNDNGVISVDQDTLQSLILNQSNASVSVVRLGQTEIDTVEGNITLTVDPPPFVPTETNSTVDAVGLVDPFMEMDPEQLERLETALQSEEAKQILGENVTAMLDMLTVEEQQNSIRYNIELDHCYTNRFSPTQPKHADSLPDVTSSDMDELVHLDPNKSAVQSPMSLSVSSTNVSNISMIPTKQKIVSMPPKIVKQPISVGGRPRRASTAMQSIATTPKLNVVNARNLTNSIQENKFNAKNEDEAVEESIFSSSESSVSDESDSDSDFGPGKGARKGVRARGGRRGLTTRGGNMAASRRRGSNKHMDTDQVRRLNLEMAAAVSAMKSPDKEDKSEKTSPGKNKKTCKSFGGKRNEEVLIASAPTNESLAVESNVLQTTNQVKANLINANMFKGDMILTKPGQDRNNQKIVYVQKQIVMNPNDIKTYGIKKQVMMPKNKFVSSQTSKLPIKDIKVPSPPISGKVIPIGQINEVNSNVLSMEIQTESLQTSPIQKNTSVVKTKSLEIKKERKKIDLTSAKMVVESTKSTETKPLLVPKKIVKKEHRKSDTHVVETLGPALFSTPDIIRRVGSINESKIVDSVGTTSIIPLSTINNVSASNSLVTTATIDSTTSSPSNCIVAQPLKDISVIDDTNVSKIDSASLIVATKINADSSILSETLTDEKAENKNAIVELLQPTLDTVSKSTSSKEMPQTMKQSVETKHIVSENNIEGDDHLLATLGMEAAKQLPNDEELLAEALLLQETLGVDLEHSGLVASSPEITDSALPASIIQPATPENVLCIKIEQPSSSVLTASTQIESVTSLNPPAPVISSSIVNSPSLQPIVKSECTSKKDSKPIQIIRGGRVITLPPIEAPATRSKRLQAKTENQVKAEKKPKSQQHNQLKVEPIIIKTERSSRTMTHVSLQKQDMIYNMDDDDEEEEEEEDEEANSGSEDDPNKLWCICRQPHNNRFMICCDMCQDWFHGKCVHVTKSMGEQMENQGIEWVCPNCLKKKNEENKAKSSLRRQRNSIDTSIESNRTLTSLNTPSHSKAVSNTSKKLNTSTGITYCVVCKKEARKSSIYCSNECILVHAEETSTKDKPHLQRQIKTDTPKSKSDSKIIVVDKKTGNVLTGTEAPMSSNLKAWLKEHPSYELIKSSNINNMQLGGKTISAVQSLGIKTNKILQGKSVNQAKMVYSKVLGSKQTVLTSNTKETLFLSDVPSLRSTASPQQRIKQLATISAKSPTTNLKQTTIKVALQQQQTVPKPLAASTPKITSIKKLQDTKPSTSQQKQSQQLPQQPQTQQPQQQLQQQQQQQQQQLIQKESQQTIIKTPPPKKAETEPIRINVRKTLAELLTSRIKDANDLTSTEEEIIEMALQIELEMFKFFKDTGQKYKAKYRSLVFNIKDTKNLTLFRKIADHSLTPDAVVKLSPEEMASQELAEWREKENKHQLEMIKKNELDLMTQAKSIVVKTHKGEQIIENDGAIDRVDPKTPVQDIVTALNSGDAISSTMDEDNLKEESFPDEGKRSKTIDDERKKKEKERDREKRRGRSRDRSSSKNSHRHSRERDRSKDRKVKKDAKHKDRERNREKDVKLNKSREKNKKKDKEKEREKKDKHKRSRKSSRSRSKGRHKELKELKEKYKDEDKKKDRFKTEMGRLSEEKSIEDKLWRHIEEETTTNTLDGNDSDLSDREPSSTVTIKTPDINDDIDKESSEIKILPLAINRGPMTVWRGFVHMPDVAKFFVTAHNVSGNSKDLMEDLPDNFEVVGRISPSTVWEYLNNMKKNATKEILIIKMTATNDEEKIPYITLYSYLNSRNRLGVLGNISPIIKDFYILPFSTGSKLPSVLLPLDGPGLEENRQHLLLGIIVVHSRKKRLSSTMLPTSLAPVPSKVAKKDTHQQLIDRSYTPPPPSAISFKEETTQAPTGSPKSKDFSVISKIRTELSTVSSDKMQLDDDDEPYSPGEPVDQVLNDDEDGLSSSSSLKNPQQSLEGTTAITTTIVSTPVSAMKGSSELQRNLEELSRQIEEEKMQIQNISSSFLGDTSTTLPGLGLDTDVAYSPSDARSFTPPPQGISKLTQPILDKVSNITIPANLQEILANVKRQESSKIDPYLPTKPSATFLTTVSSATYPSPEKYSPTYSKNSNRLSSEIISPKKETKSTLSSLSDYDIMKKAEEELAALAAASAVSAVPTPPVLDGSSVTSSPSCLDPPPPGTSFDTPHR